MRTLFNSFRLPLALVPLLWAFFFVTPPNALASLLIEPEYQYGVGATSGREDGHFYGSVMGGKLGYSKLLFMGGLDYQKTSLTYDPDDEGKKDAKYKGDDIGVFVGINFPLIFRIFGGYTFVTNLKGQNYTYHGNGYKLGIGFKFIPLLSVNLQYASKVYDERTYDGSAKRDLNEPWRFKSYSLSISIPIEIF